MRRWDVSDGGVPPGHRPPPPGFETGDIHSDQKVAMRESKIGHFSERLESQAEARKALLEKFKPKPTVQPEAFEPRAQRKARELEEVRAKRAAEKEDARLQAEAAEAARQDALANDEEFQLQLKRDDRKARKAAAKAEARAKREAKSAARR
jgi:hypothetical protein